MDRALVLAIDQGTTNTKALLVDRTGAVIAAARRSGQRIAVAESLTGGWLCSALVSVPGASAVVLGGVVAYATPLKSALLGVDTELLRQRGPVDPAVAEQMARGVRTACAVDGRPAEIGIATTGVAGPDPDPQTGHTACSRHVSHRRNGT